MAENDNRATLIAISTPLFATRGFNGVSVREIAALAGTNVSMISYYFGGKHGLYSAVLAEQFAVLQRVAEITHLDAAPVRKIELYVRAIVARYRQHPSLLRFYTSELTNPTHAFEAIVQPAIAEVIRNLREFFGDGLSHEIFREGLDPTDTAIALAGMINFYFILEPAAGSLVQHSPARDEDLIQHILDIFLNGVLKRP